MGREQRTGVYDLRENPSLADLLSAVDRYLRVTIRTSTVVRIAPSQPQPLGYDPLTQLCSVLVQQLTVTNNPDVPQGPAATVTQPPVLLVNVPVAWPRTSAGYLTFPLTIGDSGELIVQDRSLAEWRKKGYPVDPIDNWTHNRGDGVFHPGLHSDIDPIDPGIGTDPTATVLDGPPLAGIKLGRQAVEPILKGATTAAAMAAYTSAVDVAYQAWLIEVANSGGIPTAPINGKLLGVIGAANLALKATIGDWPSTKALTE